MELLILLILAATVPNLAGLLLVLMICAVVKDHAGWIGAVLTFILINVLCGVVAS